MIKNILRKIKYKLKNTFSMKIPVNNPILYGELLKGRCALITGGTSGIGFAIAEAFLRNKADIIITGRNESKIEKAVNQLKKEFAEQKVIGIVLDNCDVTKMKDIFQNPLLGGLKIDILVNNAGIIKRIPMCDMTADEFRQVVDVDLNAPFIVSKAVIPSMVKKGHGKIINICSMMSELGRETVSAYAAAKGGLKMLTRNICSEYGANNIQCNGIGPGYIATPQTAPLREKQADGSRHPFDQFICGRTPAGRWLQAEELTGPAVFLASDASNAVNGHILYVDGGILAYIGKQP